MLTVREYAELHGYNPYTVTSWCRNGKMAGVEKWSDPTKKNTWRYMIPDTAQPPAPREKPGRQRMKFGQEESVIKPARQADGTKPAVRKRTQREISLFIRRHCNTMTYGQMSEALGIPVRKLREMYDRLHERYGI